MVTTTRDATGAVAPEADTTLRTAATPDERRAWEVAARVCDPEIPVLTIEDLGVLRGVGIEQGRVTVTITPTYSGCPAMAAIRDDVVRALAAAGFDDIVVRLTLAPAWTTDWMTPAGKRKLAEFGIAPPTGRAPAGRAQAGPVRLQLSVRCPHCGSLDTRELSRFGSTSCKALYECLACLEPFDHFKVH
ncbi:phenylacetate-CoA oxygenase subunit PaaJ [Planctomonas sp. JC2975]|uniref:1,2-phenylacetyl-CoA epoxidase subunit PaaD n=1 Tax=Planctomonas sp. JC2975 TaxID=2729626 RepID=UPI0014758376|nr:1,2-phenylacetyl-CoA epoxidase subunit PaaD [Planctomonas sp. JC2975]NNC10545.1 phenylacetate-CoA oxygenase subunit PaaJ [Planctomonas sp. JC2975]